MEIEILRWADPAVHFVKTRRVPIFFGALGWMGIIAASCAYIWLGYLNVVHLRSGFDLGTYTQILYNVGEGRIPPFNTLKGMVAWGDHAHFALVFFAPVFSIFPSAVTVVVLQVLAITTSGWAIYLLAYRMVKSYVFALVSLASYLLFFGVQHALDTDFHANVLTAAALAWTFYAFHARKQVLYWVMFAVGMLTREDAAVFYVMFAAYLLVMYRKKHVRTALLTGGIALAYFLVTTFIVMPRWERNGTALAYFDIPDRADNPIGILWWIVTNPVTIIQNMLDTDAARRTIRYLFQSFGFTSLASPGTYLMAAPNLLARFLSGEEQRHVMRGHYSVSLASILSYGSIMGTYIAIRLAQRIGRIRWGRHIVIIMSTVLLIIGTYTSSLGDVELPVRQLARRDLREFRYDPNSRLYDSLLAIRSLIPPDASVAATSGLVPTLALREEIFSLPDPLPDPVDWAIISVEGNTWPLNGEGLRHTVEILRVSPQYDLVSRVDSFVLFRRISGDQ